MSCCYILNRQINRREHRHTHKNEYWRIRKEMQLILFTFYSVFEGSSLTQVGSVLLSLCLCVRMPTNITKMLACVEKITWKSCFIHTLLCRARSTLSPSFIKTQKTEQEAQSCGWDWVTNFSGQNRKLNLWVACFLKSFIKY